MSEVETTQTTPIADPENNSAVRQQREHIARLESDLKAQREQYNEVTNKLTALEREKMSEVERITHERDEARQKAQNADRLQSEIEKYTGTIESIFNQRLEALPKEAKPGFEAIVSKLENPADKLEALTAFESTVASLKPSSFGTVTQPSTAGTNTQPATPAKETTPIDPKSVINADMGWKPIPGQQGFAQ